MTDAAKTDAPVATERIFERDTAVTGAPPGKDDEIDTPAPAGDGDPAEGGNDVPPPTDGSPQG